MPSDHRRIPGTWLVGAVLAGALGWTAWVRITHPIQDIADSSGATADRRAGAVQWPDMRIDLNSADIAQFDLLPGIGPRLAERIVADRETNGPFATVGDLIRVRGVGTRTLERIGPFVVAEAPDARRSDADRPPKDGPDD